MELLTLFEYIGIVAFALSSTFVAIEYKLDLFGILVLAVTTAMGGGMVRDIILNISPPIMFVKPAYCVIAVLTAIAAIAGMAALNKYKAWGAISPNMNFFRSLITIFDAVGLGIFTIVGTDIAIAHGFGGNKFFVVFVGTITGVGGGILRDILVSRKPVVLSKEVYALAAIIGSLLYALLKPHFSGMPLVYGCAALIAAIRIVAVYTNLNLPQFQKLDL